MNNTIPPPYRPKSKRNTLQTAVRIIVALLVFAAFTLAVYISGKTIFNLWIPWSISVFSAVVSGIFLWRKWKPISGSSSILINFLIHTVCVAGIAAALVFSLNYFGSDKSSESVVTAKVVNSYSKTRYHTRRIGRRLSGRGNPYKVYYIEAELPDGRKKEFSVTLSQFNEARRSSRMRLDIEEGLLSMPVIKESTIVKAGKKRKARPANPVFKRKKGDNKPE